MRRHAKAPPEGSNSAGGRAPADFARRARLGLSAFVVLALTLLGAGVASALQTHVKGTDIAPAGPNGFQSLSGLAVDQSGGDLYAVDASGAADFSGAIDRFDSAGAFQNQITGTFNNPQDVAVDSSGTSSDGNVYLADTGNNLIRAFDSAGTPVAGFDADGELEGSAVPALLNPDATFSAPCGVAVDQATGNLYVADQGHNRIWVFDSSGAFLDSISDSGFAGPCGLAFNSSGDLYVRNSGDGKVLRFNKSGATDYGFASVLHAPSDNSTPDDPSDDVPAATDVGVEASTDHVYVDGGSQVTEYGPGGGLVSLFGQGQLGSSQGIAIDAVNEKVYVADGGALPVYGPLLTLPTVSTGAASNVQSTSATITASVDAAGGPDASCQFEYGTDTNYGQTAACDPAGPFSGFQEVSAELTGLTIGTTYHYRVVSTSASGTASGADQSFATTAVPTISIVLAPEVNETTARLEAKVNPNGSATTYSFEYGTDTSYGTSIPVTAGDLGSGTGITTAGQLLSGLTPDTTYHYRLSASNATGPATSTDRTFHTYASDVPSGLAHNRAYEMVSPPDKTGADIQANPWQMVSAADGNAVSYSSTGGFAGTGGVGILANYIAKRTPDGWVTTGITPNQEPGYEYLPGLPNQSRYTGQYTPSLSKGIFFARVPLSDEPNVAVANNLYLREDLLSGRGPNPEQGAQYRLLTNSVIPITTNEHGFNTLGATAVRLADTNPSLSHVLFESAHNLTQDAVDANLDTQASKVYEWSNGVQRLAGVLPDGAPTVSVAGRGVDLWAAPGVGCPGGYTQNTISDDGSTVFFTTPPYQGLCQVESNYRGAMGSLFARMDHSVTVKLNESERTDCADDPSCGGNSIPDPAPDPGGPQPASFWTSTNNAKKAFFTTGEQLTDDPENSGDGGLNLYSYDFDRPAGSHLTLITPDVMTIVGESEDGKYVYFTSKRYDLDPTYTFPVETKERLLYVWHNGEIRAIGNGANLGGDGIPWTEGRTDSAARVTPDGRAILFSTNTHTTAELADYNNTVAGSAGPCTSGDSQHPIAWCALETYLYRYDTDSLVCVSCAPTGAAPSRTSGGGFTYRFEASFTELRPNPTSGWSTQYKNRALSEDGSKAFFTSFDPLVPTDTNGRPDAYEYDATTQEVRLLSTGECNCDSVFAEASPDGSNALFVTAQRLVGIDRDNNRDLYDARVGGGIAAQNALPPAQCQGDACQSPMGAPNDPTPGSSTFSGAGNPVQKAKAKKRRAQQRKRARKHRKQQRARRASQRRQASATGSRG